MNILRKIYQEWHIFYKNLRYKLLYKGKHYAFIRNVKTEYIEGTDENEPSTKGVPFLPNKFPALNPTFTPTASGVYYLGYVPLGSNKPSDTIYTQAPSYFVKKLLTKGQAYPLVNNNAVISNIFPVPFIDTETNTKIDYDTIYAWGREEPTLLAADSKEANAINSNTKTEHYHVQRVESAYTLPMSTVYKMDVYIKNKNGEVIERPVHYFKGEKGTTITPIFLNDSAASYFYLLSYLDKNPVEEVPPINWDEYTNKELTKEEWKKLMARETYAKDIDTDKYIIVTKPADNNVSFILTSIKDIDTLVNNAWLHFTLTLLKKPDTNENLVWYLNGMHPIEVDLEKYDTVDITSSPKQIQAGHYYIYAPTREVLVAKSDITLNYNSTSLLGANNTSTQYRYDELHELVPKEEPSPPDKPLTPTPSTEENKELTEAEIEEVKQGKELVPSGATKNTIITIPIDGLYRLAVTGYTPAQETSSDNIEEGIYEPPPPDEKDVTAAGFGTTDDGFFNFALANKNSESVTSIQSYEHRTFTKGEKVRLNQDNYQYVSIQYVKPKEGFEIFEICNVDPNYFSGVIVDTNDNLIEKCQELRGLSDEEIMGEMADYARNFDGMYDWQLQELAALINTPHIKCDIKYINEIVHLEEDAICIVPKVDAEELSTEIERADVALFTTARKNSVFYPIFKENCEYNYQVYILTKPNANKLERDTVITYDELLAHNEPGIYTLCKKGDPSEKYCEVAYPFHEATVPKVKLWFLKNRLGVLTEKELYDAHHNLANYMSTGALSNYDFITSSEDHTPDEVENYISAEKNEKAEMEEAVSQSFVNKNDGIFVNNFIRYNACLHTKNCGKFLLGSFYYTNISIDGTYLMLERNRDNITKQISSVDVRSIVNNDLIEEVKLASLPIQKRVHIKVTDNSRIRENELANYEPFTSEIFGGDIFAGKVITGAASNLFLAYHNDEYTIYKLPYNKTLTIEEFKEKYDYLVKENTYENITDRFLFGIAPVEIVDVLPYDTSQETEYTKESDIIPLGNVELSANTPIKASGTFTFGDNNDLELRLGKGTDKDDMKRIVPFTDYFTDLLTGTDKPIEELTKKLELYKNLTLPTSTITLNYKKKDPIVIEHENKMPIGDYVLKVNDQFIGYRKGQKIVSDPAVTDYGKAFVNYMYDELDLDNFNTSNLTSVTGLCSDAIHVKTILMLDIDRDSKVKNLDRLCANARNLSRANITPNPDNIKSAAYAFANTKVETIEPKWFNIENIPYLLSGATYFPEVPDEIKTKNMEGIAKENKATEITLETVFRNNCVLDKAFSSCPNLKKVTLDFVYPENGSFSFSTKDIFKDSSNLTDVTVLNGEIEPLGKRKDTSTFTTERLNLDGYSLSLISYVSNPSEVTLTLPRDHFNALQGNMDYWRKELTEKLPTFKDIQINHNVKNQFDQAFAIINSSTSPDIKRASLDYFKNYYMYQHVNLENLDEEPRLLKGLFKDMDFLVSVEAPTEKFFPHRTDLSEMFMNCKSLSSVNLSEIKIDDVESISKMFYGCRNLKKIIMPTVLSDIRECSYAFAGIDGLQSIDLSPLSSAAFANLNELFSGIHHIQTLEIDGLCFDEATSANNIFAKSNFDNLIIKNVNLENISNLSHAFKNSTVTSLYLHDIVLSKKFSTTFLFSFSNIKKLDIDNFFRKDETSLELLFYGATVPETLRVKWYKEVPELSDVNRMFSNSTFKNLDLSSMSLSKMQNMSGMFSNATGKNLILPRIDEDLKINTTNMFKGATIDNIFIPGKNPMAYLKDSGIEDSNVEHIQVSSDQYREIDKLLEDTDIRIQYYV